jgi:hypothetical protein
MPACGDIGTGGIHAGHITKVIHGTTLEKRRNLT